MEWLIWLLIIAVVIVAAIWLKGRKPPTQDERGEVHHAPVTLTNGLNDAVPQQPLVMNHDPAASERARRYDEDVPASSRSTSDADLPNNADLNSSDSSTVRNGERPASAAGSDGIEPPKRRDEQ